LGNHKRAYEFQKTFQYLNDSLYNAQKGLEIARLEFNFERKKETRELMLEQDIQNKIKENKLQRQQFIIFGIIAALLITGIIAASLQRRKKIVQQLNTELEAQKKVLEERNEELYNLNQVKDKIFSIISHDLRSPLTTLINLIDISQDSEFTQKEMQSYLKELGHQAKHTAGMLDNLLYCVQNQRSSFTVRPEMVDVSHTVDELMSLFSLAAKQKNVKFKNQIPIGSEAFVDPNSLKLILRNLLSNAIKFSVRGGSIEVIAKKALSPNGMLQVYVKDYGVGMSEEQQKNLFNVSGVSKRGTFSEHGIGLGLVLVKEFVDQNGGTIHVDSKPGEGTTFTVTLPTEKKQQAPSLLDVINS
jgi:signal transduction histidine kinase